MNFYHYYSEAAGLDFAISSIEKECINVNPAMKQVYELAIEKIKNQRDKCLILGDHYRGYHKTYLTGDNIVLHSMKPEEPYAECMVKGVIITQNVNAAIREFQGEGIVKLLATEALYKEEQDANKATP